MKRVALGVTLLLLFGAGAARADRWVSGKRLPKPIDFPIVREKVKEHHKTGNRQKHPPQAVWNLEPAQTSLLKA